MAEGGGGAECGKKNLLGAQKCSAFTAVGRIEAHWVSPTVASLRSVISFWGALLRSIASPGMVTVCASLAMDGIQPPLLDPFVRFVCVRLM